MYLDSAYIAKFYLNESDSPAVRAAIRGADSLTSSEWSVVEVACAFHRHMRQGELSARQFQDLMQAFLKHCEAGLWTLIPVGDQSPEAGLAMLQEGLHEILKLPGAQFALPHVAMKCAGNFHHGPLRGGERVRTANGSPHRGRIRFVQIKLGDIGGIQVHLPAIFYPRSLTR